MKRFIVFLVVCLNAVFFAQEAPSSPHTPDAKTVSHALSGLSIPFIENKGQIDKDVAYYAKTFGATLFVTKKGEMVYGFPEYTLVERIPGLTPHPAGLTPSKTTVSSFIGNDPSRWQKALSTYTAVSLGEMTPGITVTLHAYGGKIEKIITVAPRTDPSLTITIDGASSLCLGHDGELIVHTDKGDLTFSKPVAYQEIGGKRIPVLVAYLLPQESSTYGFSLGPYDKNHALIIDPVLVYSTYLGGQSDDEAFAVKVDPSGNAYVAGYTIGDFPTRNPYQDSPKGTGDAFITKFDPSGDVVYSTYLGGSAGDVAYTIAVDSSGNAYVAGSTLSTDFPTQNPYQGSNAGQREAFVTKLSPSGNSLVYSTYLGGSADDYISAIAVDSSGHAYVAGLTQSTDFPTQNPYQGAYGGGNQDAFLAKFSSAGNSLDYSTYLGGSENDAASAVGLSSSGNAYVAGYTFSTDFPVKHPYQTSNAGWVDAFVTKFTSTGKSLEYSTYLGGSSHEWAQSIVVDSSGNAYVAGITYSTDFPTQNPYQRAYGGGIGDVFVTKFSPLGNTLVYSTYLGGKDWDYGYAIAVDSSGRAYVAGITNSADFPTKDPYQGSHAGEFDAFVTKFTTSGNALKYSTYLGGSNNDYASGIAVDSSGNAYVAGITLSTDFPTQNPYQGANAGQREAFVTKFGPAYRLTLKKTGNGNGTVTSEPSGIDCGITCTAQSATFAVGTMVTLTAQADTYSTFTRWSGGGCSETGDCIVTISADMTLTATFTSLPPILTSPNGGEVFPSGSDTTITWTAPPTMTKFKLSYSVDSGITWSPVSTGFVSGTRMPWMVPLLPRNKTKCLVRINAFDVYNRRLGSDKSDGPFTIEVLTITDPVRNSACTSGQPCLIAWNRSPYIDAHTGKLSYSTDGGLTWKLIANTITESDTSYSSWIPAVKVTKKNCKVKLVYKNDKGVTVGTATSGKFTINKTP